MINVLSYIGMSLQSEVCLWTLLGLVRTIFDATLFKVNANLKQVWHMNMPEELSLPVQRVLRTMISGIMLVQCFTVYVYLASYIVLLYPVFLEERPTLVLPWLLLAAIRKLLCELTSLALGLGTCVLLGAARPPCIKFVVIKVISIMPSFYMWMLLYSYYHALKVASVFKTFPVVLPPSEHDYGLELAVRRRRTKSLLGEEQLRRRLISNFYNEHSQPLGNADVIRHKAEYSSRMTHATDTSAEENVNEEINVVRPLSTTSNRMMMSDTGCYEDWFGSEVMVPRDSDRILEQFGVMMLRIGAYLTKEGANPSDIFNTGSIMTEHDRSTHDCTTMPPDDTDTPPLVGSSRGRTASYLREYPQIFGKRTSDFPLHSDMALTLKTDDGIATTQVLRNPTQIDNIDISNRKYFNTEAISNGSISVETEAPMTSKEINIKETPHKKLQSMSSEKSVTFESTKTKVDTIPKETNEVREKEAGTSTTENDKTTDFKEKDSLESIIKEMKKRRTLKIKSYKKDENNNKARGATTSQNRKLSDVSIHSDDGASSDSSKSNNLSNNKKKKINNTNK